MTDLVSTPPLPASPANSTVATPDWWPDIDVNTVRDQIALGGEIPHARLIEALGAAAIETIDQLTEWQGVQQAAGADTLAGVEPNLSIGGVTRLELLFLSAVAASAAARLADRNPNLTATREGSDRAEERRNMADDFRRDAIHAVRAIQGQSRTTSELI